ncbi:hypothetical protein Tco_0681394 [Tanacetum coccineum]|uniref:Uncharacterized protein n=1 Tax=Tanacetum coccineum TaxID=301880 RepID=A0ABQ4XPD8_9ASTR
MGHIIPLFEFAMHLVTQHNIQVTFLVITTESAHAQNDYIKSFNPHPNFHIVNLPPADMSGLLASDMTDVARLSVIVQESIRPLVSILSKLKGPKLKALIIDMFSTDVFDVCKELYIPIYSFFTTSTEILAFALYLPTLDQEVEGEFMDLLKPVNVPGCNPIRIQDLMDQVRNRKIDEYKWFYLHFSRLPMATGIFVNTWDDLDPVSLKALEHEPFFLNIPTPPVYYPIGPLTKKIEPVLTEYEKEIMAWLGKQPKDSVLYVALGSGGTLTSEQLTELAWGLEMSKQRFIMVVRKPSDYAAAGYFNAGSGSDDPKAYLPEGFAERTNRVGLVVSSWAPQVKTNYLN